MLQGSWEAQLVLYAKHDLKTHDLLCMAGGFRQALSLFQQMGLSALLEQCAPALRIPRDSSSLVTFTSAWGAADVQLLLLLSDSDLYITHFAWMISPGSLHDAAKG